MKRILWAIPVFATLGCVVLPRRGDDLQPFVAAAGRYSLMAAQKPAPAKVCENCRGLGKVGDGKVFVVCPVCKGGTTKPCATGSCTPR
jgi:hypothetical protein